jgi:ribosomal protein S6--L-glutamate ligase
VLKPLFSTKARGMRVVKSGPDARARLERFRGAGNRVMYIQKKMDLPGRDLGIAFLGGQYLATYARIGDKGAWTTTTHFGGRYEPFEPSGELVDLARRAQAPFDLDFTCVDVAETEEGPIVFEVSAFGGFRGLKEAHGIDASERFADYVLRKIGHA